MTIVVLVKQVPDMNAVRIDTATGKARLTGKAMNSYDAFSIQHALTLKEKLGSEIVAVTAGPPAAKDALTRALAMGADRGVHIDLSDQDARDSLDMANVLAEAIKDGIGRVHIEDSVWQVTGPDLPAGASVRIVGAKGPVLVVEPVGLV